MPPRDHAGFRREAARAILGGGVFETRTRIKWGLAGDCSSPQSVVRHGRPPPAEKVIFKEADFFKKGRSSQRDVIVKPGTAIPLELTYVVRCGTCEACIRHKRQMWYRRAKSEITSTIGKGARVWFVTLTCSPDYLYGSRCIAESEMSRSGVDFWDDTQVSPAQRSKALGSVIYRDIQKYLKRLREGRRSAIKSEIDREIPPAAIRFLCVEESHQSGEPHWHMLIHEMYPDRPVRQRDIEDANWIGGHLFTKLLAFDRHQTVEKGARYICKYIAKEGGRVRSSKRYGCEYHLQDATQGRIAGPPPEEHSRSDVSGSQPPRSETIVRKKVDVVSTPPPHLPKIQNDGRSPDEGGDPGGIGGD